MNCRRFLLAICLSILFCIAGCAGGSKGTGGEGYYGRVLDAAQQPVAGVTVTIIETGDSSVTDDQGTFGIETSVREGSATVKVESTDFDNDITITNIPPKTHRVMFNIELKEEKNEKPEAKEIEFIPDEGPRPTHTATPKSTRTPKNTPTPKPTAAPGVSQTSTPAPTATSIGGGTAPTPTPTPAPVVTTSPTPLVTQVPSSTATPPPTQVPTLTPTARPTETPEVEDPRPTPTTVPTGIPPKTPTPLKTPTPTPEPVENGEDVESTGTIQAITSTSITVAGRTFSVPSSIRVINDDGKTIAFSTLKTGQRVHVTGTWVNGTPVARLIEL